MLEKLSEKFASKLINDNIISEDEKDIYIYGFYQFTMMLLNVVTTIILGIVFKAIIPCVLLNFSYIPVRISAGGYHADNPVKCYIYSSLMVAVLLFIIRYVHIPDLFLLIMFMFSVFVILHFSPVETENNKLDEIEKKVYRRRTFIVMGIEIACCLIFQFCSMMWVSEIIVLGIFTESLMLVLGILKNN